MNKVTSRLSSYKKTFEVGWSELDPNRHMANVAYFRFFNNVRVALFAHFGADQNYLADNKLAPAVLSEHCYYFKEIYAQEHITVDMVLIGETENKKIHRVVQHMVNQDSELKTFYYLDFGFIHMDTRKLLVPSDVMVDVYEYMPRSDDYKLLSREDLEHAPPIPNKRTYKPHGN